MASRATFCVSLALSVAFLMAMPSPAAAQTTLPSHAITGSVCNGTDWLVLSPSGCEKPASDIANESESRGKKYAKWVGEDGICKFKTFKVQKCCYKEVMDGVQPMTNYQYSAQYNIKCSVKPKTWKVKDKYEFAVPTATRLL